jgi:hypothetical protein
MKTGAIKMLKITCTTCGTVQNMGILTGLKKHLLAAELSEEEFDVFLVMLSKEYAESREAKNTTFPASILAASTDTLKALYYDPEYQKYRARIKAEILSREPDQLRLVAHKGRAEYYTPRGA